MSQQRGGQGRGRRRGSKQRQKPADLWRPVPRLDQPDPIRPSADPTTLIRSLGKPPLQGQGTVAEHYFAAVAERAATLATALALSADLLEQRDELEEIDEP